MYYNSVSYPQRFPCVCQSNTIPISRSSWLWPAPMLTSHSWSIRTPNDRIPMPTMEAPRNPPLHLRPNIHRMSIEKPYLVAAAVDDPNQSKTRTTTTITPNPKHLIRKPLLSSHRPFSHVSPQPAAVAHPDPNPNIIIIIIISTLHATTTIEYCSHPKTNTCPHFPRS